MISTVVAWVAITQDAPRRRTLLDNGVSVHVERTVGQRLSVQLIASFRGEPEPEGQRGWRHLLEHLILRGSDGKLDERLERQGMFITGRTFRDALQIEVFGQTGELKEAIAAVIEATKVADISQEDIAKEVRVIGQESALRSDAQNLTSAAWDFAYGAAGRDPLGDQRDLDLATPEKMRELAARTFRSAHVAISIAGDVDLSAATREAQSATAAWKVTKLQPIQSRGTANLGRVESRKARGEAIAVEVSSAWSPDFAPNLVLAFAVTLGVEGAFVSYTPSHQRSLLTAGQAATISGLVQAADELDEEALAERFALAKNLAIGWIVQQTETPASLAWTRGLTLALSANLRWDQVAENVRNVGWTKARNALANWRMPEQRVTVVGSQ